MPDQTSESPTGGNRQGFQKSTNLAKKGIDMDNMSCGDEEFKGSLAPVGRQPLTMSSREIADLTNKEHKNVLRDIRVMLDGLKIEPVTFAGSYLDANGLAWKLRNMADEIEYHDPGELAEIEELPRWAARLINDIRRIVGIN